MELISISPYMLEGEAKVFAQIVGLLIPDWWTMTTLASSETLGEKKILDFSLLIF